VKPRPQFQAPGGIFQFARCAREQIPVFRHHGMGGVIAHFCGQRAHPDGLFWEYDLHGTDNVFC
jgi:hypothetical protein